MTVRFQCSACAQPIEVDDEWAARPVTCPYCRRTITAPAESTIDEPHAIPVATGLGPQASGDQGPAIGGVQPQMMPPPFPQQAPSALVADHPNRIAIVSLALASAMILLGVLGSLLLVPHAKGLEQLANRAMELEEEGKGQLAAQQQATQEWLDEEGGMSPAFMVAMFTYCMAPILWIPALICGIIGVRRVRHRGLAIASLCICGFCLIFVCAGGAASMMGVGV